MDDSLTHMLCCFPRPLRQGLDLEVAKKSFLRLRDLKYLELIHSIEVSSYLSLYSLNCQYCVDVYRREEREGRISTMCSWLISMPTRYFSY